MSSRCNYVIIVKGKKNACYAFMGSQNAWERKILSKTGTEDDYTLRFAGSCNYYLDGGCEPWKENNLPVLPADYQQAYDKAEKYIAYDIQSRSKMFNVEVLKNELDIDSALEYGEDPDQLEMELVYSGVVGNLEHYINGESVAMSEDECPDELLVFESFDFDSLRETEIISDAGDFSYDEIEYSDNEEEYYEESANAIDEERQTELYHKLLDYAKEHIFLTIPDELANDLKKAEKYCLTYHDPDWSHPLFFTVSYLYYVQEPNVDVESILSQLGASEEEINEIMSGPIELYC